MQIRLQRENRKKTQTGSTAFKSIKKAEFFSVKNKSLKNQIRILGFHFSSEYSGKRAKTRFRFAKLVYSTVISAIAFRNHKNLEKNAEVFSRLPFQSVRGSRRCNRGSFCRFSERRKIPNVERRYGFRKDVHHGKNHRKSSTPDPHHKPQQDALSPALQGIQDVFSEQRSRIFCLVLRLLPARSLCSGKRPLHRKRRKHQQRDRPT